MLTSANELPMNATIPFAQSQDIVVVDNSFDAKRSNSLMYSKSSVNETQVTPTRKTSLFRPLGN